MKRRLYYLILVFSMFHTSGMAQTNIISSANTNCGTIDLNKMKDGNKTTNPAYSYDVRSGCDFNINLGLSGTNIKVVRVVISANKPGIYLKVGGISYFTTQANIDEFYYVNPSGTGFSSLELRMDLANNYGTEVYEIEVYKIDINLASLAYGYDAAGNMTSREIVIGSAKSAEMVSNDSTEIIGETNSDSKNDAEIPDASSKNQFDELLGDNNVTIYPNPTQGQLRVAIGDIQPDDKVSVTVHSLAGTLLFSGTLNDNLIDLNKAASGVYILTIVINDKSQNWRIVKE
jgi:hypothetical protein